MESDFLKFEQPVGLTSVSTCSFSEQRKRRMSFFGRAERQLKMYSWRSAHAGWKHTASPVLVSSDTQWDLLSI